MNMDMAAPSSPPIETLSPFQCRKSRGTEKGYARPNHETSLSNSPVNARTALRKKWRGSSKQDCARSLFSENANRSPPMLEVENARNELPSAFSKDVAAPHDKFHDTTDFLLGNPDTALPPADASFVSPIKKLSPPASHFAMMSQMLDSSNRFSRADAPVKVLPHLVLGSWKQAKNRDLMTMMGITHFCSVAKDCKPMSCDMDPNLTYYCIAAKDDKEYQILDDDFEAVRRFIDGGIAANGCVFLHCRAGINRSATLAIAYIMFTTRRPLFEVVQEVFSQRPIILTNTNFQQQLVHFAFDQGLL